MGIFMKHKLVFENRAAGILLPLSSLPSEYGIGSMGKQAYNWLDFLSNAGQRYWQVLPLGPTSYGDSPYQSLSAFAGNSYFIDFELLQEQQLLKPQEYQKEFWGKSKNSVDYGILFQNRKNVLKKAFQRFDDKNALQKFRELNAHWLDDYALYMSIKSHNKHRPWTMWDETVRLREPKALMSYKNLLKQDVDYYIFEQYIFFQQWNRLRNYAAEKNIEIIGDIPIYVSLDSSDVWAKRELFQLDNQGLPTSVAGVPPDYFCADGQLWGNPLYKWDVLKEDGYKWWIERMKSSFELYDVVRIDHFRGLESYYSVPYGHDTAKNGTWKPGPGMDFVNAIKKEFANARIIAEDLGFLTDEVHQLLQKSGFPGMKILQFAFDSREESDYTPYRYRKNSVVYTGTHDNDTVKGWTKSAPNSFVELAMDYMNCRHKRDMTMSFIRTAFQTASNLAVVPMQDWLNLDSRARINIPATMGGNNWRWRMTDTQINAQLIKNIKHITKLYGRFNQTSPKK